MRAGLLALCFLLPAAAFAHVGSPNVFFEGKAGQHLVRVGIRPPVTLPGLAQVDVRMTGNDAARVTIRPVFWEAGEKSAPVAIEAKPVEEIPGLYHASVWLWRRGSYKVEIAAFDPAGVSGTAVVPLSSAVLLQPQMPVPLRVLLGLLGFTLAVSALLVIRAAASPIRRRRATAIGLLLLIASVGGLALRWRVLATEFAERALDRPIRIATAIRDEGSLRVLQLAPSAEHGALPWDSLLPDHGKLMHLFLVSAHEPRVFAHLHPVRRHASAFENVLPPLPAGDYQLYAEITGMNGMVQSLIGNVALPAPQGPALPPQADAAMVNEKWCRPAALILGNAEAPRLLDADDSWLIAAAVATASKGTRTQVAVLASGHRMVFQNAGDLVANCETALRFSVFDAAGRRARIEPYIGMRGHAVLLHASREVFTHLHPSGSFSMAAQDAFRRADALPETMEVPTEVQHEVQFPYGFPKPGTYRLWIQVRLQGRVETGVFDVRVATE